MKDPYRQTILRRAYNYLMELLARIVLPDSFK